MHPGPDRHGRASPSRCPGCFVVLSLLGCPAHVKLRLSRGGVVDENVEKTVSKNPRRVAWGYDFTFWVLLGSLMVECRSGRRKAGVRPTQRGSGSGQGQEEDGESRFWWWWW